MSTLHNRYGMVATSAEGAIGGSTDFVRTLQICYVENYGLTNRSRATSLTNFLLSTRALLSQRNLVEEIILQDSQ